MTCWKKKEKRVEKKYWKPNVVHPESVKEVNEEFMVKFEKVLVGNKETLRMMQFYIDIAIDERG